MSMNYCRHPVLLLFHHCLSFIGEFMSPPIILLNSSSAIQYALGVCGSTKQRKQCTQPLHLHHPRVVAVWLSVCPDLHRRKSIIIRYPFACGWAFHCLLSKYHRHHHYYNNSIPEHGHGEWRQTVPLSWKGIWMKKKR